MRRGGVDSPSLSPRSQMGRQTVSLPLVPPLEASRGTAVQDSAKFLTAAALTGRELGGGGGGGGVERKKEDSTSLTVGGRERQQLT